MENLAMKELERGREYANQLQQLILKFDNGELDEALTMSYAQDLADKVDDCLRNAILLLNCQDSPPNSDESHKRSESRSANTNKDPTRVSPQKRKSIQTWEDYSKIGPKEDGYAWRKYGEKFILNAKHPRCYFRCTYKYDQGCEATKQVQIMKDDPPLYRTTYFGHHTCSKPQMLLDSHHLSSSTTHLICFNNNHNNKATFDHNNNNTTILSQPPSFPQSHFRNLHDYVPSPLFNDYLLSPAGEVLPYESDGLIDVISSSKIWRSTALLASD